MNILITGATGFVGSHLTDLLEQQGHNLYVLVRNQAKYEEFNVKGNIIKGSLAIDDGNTWIEELPENLDTVIHLAGIVQSYDVEQFYKINATATKTLVKDLQKRYDKIHFILLSSLAAWGPGLPSQKTVDEQSTPHPVSHYGISKLTAEKFVKQYSPESWQLSILRPPMVIGPRDPAILEVFKMVQNRIVIYEGSQGMRKEYSFISVFDLIQNINTVLENPQENQDFFVAHPISIYYDELMQEIKNNIKVSFTLNIRIPLTLLVSFAFGVKYIKKILPITIPLTPDKIAEIRQKSWICSSQKIKQQYDVTYQDNLSEIIKMTFDDYKQRNWL